MTFHVSTARIPRKCNCKRNKTRNKTLVNENAIRFYLTSNVKGVKLVTCNAYYMEIFSKKMFLLENDNIADEVALQLDTERFLSVRLR